MRSTLVKWLWLGACGSTLLASGCLDSAQLQSAVSSGIQVFIATIINTFLQSALSSALST